MRRGTRRIENHPSRTTENVKAKSRESYCFEEYPDRRTLDGHLIAGDGSRELVNSNLRGARCLIKQRPAALRDDVCHFYANYMYVCRWWRRATRLRRRIGRRNALMQASILVAVIHTAPPCRMKRRRFAFPRLFRSPPFYVLVPPVSYSRN